MIPVWVQAGFRGAVAGGAPLVGAAIAYWIHVPRQITASAMAFGSGVPISALSFDLMDQAYHRGGFTATAAGFIGGAAVYAPANWALARHGAKQRKRSGGQQPSEDQQPGSGLGIAVGFLIAFVLSRSGA